MMYQYKYVAVYTGGRPWDDNAQCGHRAVIDEHAAQGWRYVGCIPTRFSGEGGAKEIDLIFEREADTP